MARNDVAREKAALRARMRAWRDSLGATAKGVAAKAIAEHGVALVAQLRENTAGGVVSGFAPMPDELDIWPLLGRLHEQGVRLALPAVVGKGAPLVFRAWKPGDTMGRGIWNIPEPTADKPVVDPDILLVPLLAFDARGGRLGYGGGFYDRTLGRLRASRRVTAVGLAYDEQRVDAVPHLDYDQRLDWVLTPSGPIRCEADASAVPR